MADDRENRRRDEVGDGAEPAPGSARTADQLRADIDSGRTHDKVAHEDPAAAPLGTDDEAAGTPPTAQQVETAHREETGRTVHSPAPADRAAPAGAEWRPTMIWGGAIVLGLIILAVVLV